MFIPLHDQNPLKIVAFQAVTFSIILTCTLVYLYQKILPEQQYQAFMLSYGMLPAVLFEHRTLAEELVRLPAEFTLFSSIFLHSSWLHLIGNMAFLWVFGDNVEDSMGHWRFLLFYCLCGVVASFAHGLADSQSISPLIGASGAVSGVIGAYLLLHPKVKVLVLVMMRVPLRLPAYWVLGFWIGLQIYSVMFVNESTTAWWAHIGGLVCGMVLIPFFKYSEVPLFDRDRPH
ncbi:MAG: rhomboid family intramembrane serine protease [Pseudomonadota bacterium]